MSEAACFYNLFAGSGLVEGAGEAVACYVYACSYQEGGEVGESGCFRCAFEYEGGDEAGEYGSEEAGGEFAWVEGFAGVYPAEDGDGYGSEYGEEYEGYLGVHSGSSKCRVGSGLLKYAPVFSAWPASRRRRRLFRGGRRGCPALSRVRRGLL